MSFYAEKSPYKKITKKSILISSKLRRNLIRNKNVVTKNLNETLCKIKINTSSEMHEHNIVGKFYP